MLAAGPAAGGLTRDHGQFRAEVVQMQEGHGPSDRPEPEGDGGTSPGASWVPWDSGQPGRQSYPVPPADLPSEEQQSEQQEAPAGPLAHPAVASGSPNSRNVLSRQHRPES